MTDLEINKAISMHVFGWEDYDMLLWCEEDGLPAWTGRKLHGATKKENKWHEVPDYCNDLNAMHQAESTLWIDECLVEKYEENIKDEYLKEVGYQGYGYWFMAGASVRARAFLKTIGKWKD